eukprot:CAMPEP_0116022310 /NCGR_PEP_ID=MMETSP0321-20121206/10911_1 /TAXON_ID=163516 /ORGANISM="Leptocylindrus danicus var. danicus, Strain B650" /LENGTH=361 /DNA_ID=CAMNT_0003493357 /DNA_START=231 /DNA_END=1316 /DNA_ORIENTATION=-
MDEYMKHRASRAAATTSTSKPEALQLQHSSSRMLGTGVPMATYTTAPSVNDSRMKLLATNALDNYRSLSANATMVLPRMVSASNSITSSSFPPTQNQVQQTFIAATARPNPENPAASAHGDNQNSNGHDISISYFSPNATKTETERTRGAFPRKLHEMLANPEYSECITWMPDGKSWRVLDSAKLESQVLSKFFKHSKYTSFNRQVNLWGFTRITKGVDSGCYFHRLFVRHDVGLCTKMLRKKETPRRRHPEISARMEHVGTQNVAALPLVSAWGPLEDPMHAALSNQIEHERIRASLYQNAQYALNAPRSSSANTRIEMITHRQHSPPHTAQQRVILVDPNAGAISRHGPYTVGYPSRNY